MSHHVRTLPPDGRTRSSTTGCRRHGIDYEKFLDGKPWLVTEDVGALRAQAAHRMLRIVGCTDKSGQFYVQAIPCIGENE